MCPRPCGVSVPDLVIPVSFCQKLNLYKPELIIWRFASGAALESHGWCTCLGCDVKNGHGNFVVWSQGIQVTGGGWQVTGGGDRIIHGIIFLVILNTINRFSRSTGSIVINNYTRKNWSADNPTTPAQSASLCQHPTFRQWTPNTQRAPLADRVCGAL